MNRIYAALAVLALALMVLGFNAPAQATSVLAGGSADNPIVVADPADVPEGAVEDAVSTFNTPDECDTTRSWVLTVKGQHHDAVTHVVHHDAVTHEETNVISEEVPEVWANFSPDHQQGPFTGPPSWPSDDRGTWHLHDKIPGGHEGDDGVYQRDNPHSGRADWFFRQNHKDAVTETVVVVDQEAYDETVVDQEAYDEPDVVTYFAWTDGAECPVDNPNPPTTPNPPNSPNPPTHNGTPHHPNNPPAQVGPPVTTRLTALPNTGQNNSLLPLGVGVALVLAGAGALLFRKRA